MEKTYYYLINGQQQGPVTLAELKGKGITRETLVWTEDMAEWQEAQTLPELGGLFVNVAQATPEQPQIPEAPSASVTTGTNAVDRPKTWLVESILVTLFCCLPFGIVGIVNASKVDSALARGDIDGAVQASEAAKKWVKIGAICGAVAIGIYVLLAIAGYSFGDYYDEYYY